MFMQKRPNTKGMPSTIKADYLTDPRVALAMEVQKAGASTTPVGSHMEGIARMLQGAVGGYQADSLRNEYTQAADAYRKGLGSSLAGATSYEDAVQRLQATNDPNLMDLAAELQGKGLEQKIKSQAEIEQQRALYTDPEILKGKMAIAGAGRTQVNVPVNTEKTLFGNIAEKYGEDVPKRYRSAQNAALSIAGAHRAKDLLDSGVIAGFGADWQMGTANAMMEAGIIPKTSDTAKALANTKAYVSTLGTQMLEKVKQLGYNPSNVDLKFVEKMSAGDVELNEESLRAVLDANEIADRALIEQHNKEVMPYSEEFTRNKLPSFQVDLPPTYVPKPKELAPTAQLQPQTKKSNKLEDLKSEFGLK